MPSTYELAEQKVLETLQEASLIVDFLAKSHAPIPPEALDKWFASLDRWVEANADYLNKEILSK